MTEDFTIEQVTVNDVDWCYIRKDNVIVAEFNRQGDYVIARFASDRNELAVWQLIERWLTDNMP
ncbi:MAG: hypothetical protein L0229_20250 [Blastocatellia bacterium]|nr:hypothetical protein [Blastocatellia bacterium]